MKLYEIILNELKVRTTEDKPNMVIAYRDALWLLNDDENDKNIIDDIIIYTNLSNQYVQHIDTYENFFDIGGSRPDIFVAGIEDGDTFRVYDGQLDPRNSALAKKVAKYLNIKNFIFTDYQTIDSTATHTTLPDVVYHGTSLDRVAGIVKTGLLKQQRGNWESDGIYHHSDLVFVTTNKSEAVFHALRTTGLDNSFPVLLEIKIPDKNKLIVDYDVGVQLYGSGSDNFNNYYDNNDDFGGRGINPVVTNIPSKDKKREDALWKLYSIFGYKGRIPASFIVAYYIALTEDRYDLDHQDFTLISKEKLKDIIKSFSYISDYFGKEDAIGFLSRVRFTYSFDQIVAEFGNYEDEDEDEDGENTLTF